MTKVFRGYCNGYSILTASLDELQVWIDARKLDCRGSVLKLHQGFGTERCATFAPNCPSREVRI